MKAGRKEGEIALGQHIILQAIGEKQLKKCRF